MTSNYMVMPGLKFLKRNRSFPDTSRSKDAIIKLICERYNISFEKLQSKTRKREIVYPRHLAMAMMYRYSRISLSDIGKIFNRDHTTVIHAKNIISDLIDTDDTIKADAKELEYLIIG